MQDFEFFFFLFHNKSIGTTATKSMEEKGHATSRSHNRGEHREAKQQILTSVNDLLAWGDSRGEEEPMRLERSAELLHPAGEGGFV